MLRLAMPVLIEQVLLMLVWFSDRVLTGHYLGTAHLAAITLVTYVLWLFTGLFATVAIAATAMVARFVGAGDGRSARQVTGQAFVLGAAIAVVATGLGFWAGPWFVRFLQLEGLSAVLADRYLAVVVPVLPLVMIQAVGIACLRGAGDMVSGLVVMAVVNAVNVAVSWLLVLGPGPVPRLGWSGIALGTMAGFVVGGLLVLALMVRGRAGLLLRWRLLVPDFRLIGRLLRIGIPGGADMLVVIGCQLWFLSVINRMGDLSAAAHGVAICAESLAFLPGAAFQAAAATLAGQFLGAGDDRRAGRSVLMACVAGGGLMVVAGLLFLGLAPELVRLFVGPHQAAVAALATPLLRIVSVGIPALAVTMILSGGLRGAGDTRWPMAASLTGLLGVRLPLAYWLGFDAFQLPWVEVPLAGMGFGVIGAWYAMVLDLWLRAAILAARFWHGGWKRVAV